MRMKMNVKSTVEAQRREGPKKKLKAESVPKTPRRELRKS
jgi:hypothetical protein